MSYERASATCPVCQKPVGSWYKSGMHPKCERKVLDASIDEARKAGTREVRLNGELGQAIGRMSQSQRDQILRSINGGARR